MRLAAPCLRAGRFVHVRSSNLRPCGERDGTATTVVAARTAPLESVPDGAGWASHACRPAAPVRNALARVLHSVPALPLILRTAATAPTGC